MTFDSPADALDAWLQAWREQDWEKMLQASQLSWREKSSTPDLSDWFGFRELISWEIQGGENIGESCYRVVVYVAYMFAEERRVRAIAPTVVLDGGSWGVNPVSALREV